MLNVEVITEREVGIDELLSWQVSGAKFASALKRYRLFDNEKQLAGEETPEKDFKRVLAQEDLTLNDVIYFEIYAYIHGDIALSLSGFSCPWDSGFAGYIYFTKEDLRRFYNVKRITKKIKEQVEEAVKCAIDDFNSKVTENIISVNDEVIGGYFSGVPEEDEVKNFVIENFNIKNNEEFNISYQIA